MLKRQWDRQAAKLDGGEMSNARGLESVVEEDRQKDKCVSGLRVFSGAEREGAFLHMQEARALAASGQASRLSARKSGAALAGWPVGAPGTHGSKNGWCYCARLQPSPRHISAMYALHIHVLITAQRLPSRPCHGLASPTDPGGKQPVPVQLSAPLAQGRLLLYVH